MMTPEQQKANTLIEHFSKVANGNFKLKNGICSIYDQNKNEVLTIELPKSSDSLILSCTLTSLADNNKEAILMRLMQLNYEIKAMQGCWLAIDPDSNLTLCYLLPLKRTDEPSFTDTAQGFIEQVSVLRPFLSELQIRLAENISSPYMQQ